MERARYRQTGSTATKSMTDARASHEAKTGQIANMLQLGWKCRAWSAKGEPTRFTKYVPLGPGLAPSHVRMVRVYAMWRMEIVMPGDSRTKSGIRYPTIKKLDTPLQPGPVAMAIWFEVETSNGSVRIRQSEDKART